MTEVSIQARQDFFRSRARRRLSSRNLSLVVPLRESFAVARDRVFTRFVSCGESLVEHSPEHKGSGRTGGFRSIHRVIER
jgi:hypothetical protein